MFWVFGREHTSHQPSYTAPRQKKRSPFSATGDTEKQEDARGREVHMRLPASSTLLWTVLYRVPSEHNMGTVVPPQELMWKLQTASLEH